MNKLKEIFTKRNFKTCGKVLLCCLGFFAIMVMSQMFFGCIAQIICECGYKMSDTETTVIVSIVNDLGIVLIGYIFYNLNQSNFINECEINKVKFSAILKAIVLGLSLISISSILVIFITKGLHITSSNYEDKQKWYSTFSQNLKFLIFPVIIGPICEEILCRGMLLHTLKKFISFKKAIIIQAIFFGLIHGNTIQFAYTFLMGIIAGYLVYYTKSILPSMAFHMANNFFALVIVQILSKNDFLGTLYLIIAPIVLIAMFLNIRRTCNFRKMSRKVA